MKKRKNKEERREKKEEGRRQKEERRTKREARRKRKKKQKNCGNIRNYTKQVRRHSVGPPGAETL